MFELFLKLKCGSEKELGKCVYRLEEFSNTGKEEDFVKKILENIQNNILVKFYLRKSTDNNKTLIVMLEFYDRVIMLDNLVLSCARGSRILEMNSIAKLIEENDIEIAWNGTDLIEENKSLVTYEELSMLPLNIGNIRDFLSLMEKSTN